MTGTIETDVSLEDNIRQAISDEQIQFWSRHPAPEYGWKTTRALSPEIVAFKNDEVDPAIPRLGVEFYREGETDEDGHTWENDSYHIDIRDLAQPEVRSYILEDVFEIYHDRAFIQDKDVLIETLVHIMTTVVNERHPEA